MKYYIITNHSWIEKEYELYLDRDIKNNAKFESSLDVVKISIVFEKYHIKNSFWVSLVTNFQFF